MLRVSILITFSLVIAANAGPSPNLATFYVCSDTTDWVQGPDTPSTGSYAVLSYDYPLWQHVSGAQYIWDSYLNTNPAVKQTIRTTKKFYASERIISGSLEYVCDDDTWFYLNGVYLSDCQDCESGAAPLKCNITKNLIPGVNILQAKVTNHAIPGWTPQQNPGAFAYKMAITVDLI